MKAPIRLVAVEEALLEASSKQSSVYGFVRDGLIQILSAEPVETLIGIGMVESKRSKVPGVDIHCRGGSVRLVLATGIPVPDEVQVVAVDQALDSRRVSVGPNGIERKHVLGIGTGSIGSMMALLMAEAGVRRFDLVDDDLLEAHNLSRHVCDLRDLGRVKAQAVAETLRWRRAQARPIQADYRTMPDAPRRELVARADLVIASTDSPQAQFLANEDCIATGTVGVFVGAYERACGGEIVLVRPGEGPCLFCSVGFRAGIANGIAVKERRAAYQDADVARLVAEPGLGVDITYLASVAAAHALALLDPAGSRGDLLTRCRGFKLLHAGSKPRDVYAELFYDGPFDFVHARVERAEPCPVCGWHTAEEVTGDGVRG